MSRRTIVPPSERGSTRSVPCREQPRARSCRAARSVPSFARDTPAVVLDGERSRSSVTLSRTATCVASAWRATLVRDSCAIRKSAVTSSPDSSGSSRAARARTDSRPPGEGAACVRSAATSPRSSRIGGRSEWIMPRTAPMASSISPTQAPRARQVPFRVPGVPPAATRCSLIRSAPGRARRAARARCAALLLARRLEPRASSRICAAIAASFSAVTS